MTTVGVSIMAHRSRSKYVSELVERLDVDPEVVWDDAPASSDPAQRWRTACRAWEAAAAQGHEWSLCLQDDAMVCDDLCAALCAFLSGLSRPAVVSPYMGVGGPVDRHVERVLTLADRAKQPWAEMALCYWGVAVALPTELIPDLIATSYGERRNYDTRLARWARDLQRLPTLYTVPSLVDHRQGPSLIGRPAEGRRAARFVGEGVSALSVDWSGAGGIREESKA